MAGKIVTDQDERFPKVMHALNHVRKHHPNVLGVVFNAAGRWFFYDSVFSRIVFGKHIITAVLEAACDEVNNSCGFPAVFEPFREDGNGR